MGTRLLAVVLLAALAGPNDASGSDALRAALGRGDAGWARRAEGHDGARIRPAAVDEAAQAYAEALSLDGDALDAHWRRVRALWFGAQFAEVDDAERKARSERAREAAEAGLRALARALDGRDPARLEPEELAVAVPPELSGDAARALFWSALAWGTWSRSHGLLAAVRQGVAGRMHRYALGALALDPTVERGGPQRLLARLHAELPRVPFVSGWVDRDEALRWAERAFSVDPHHPGNQLSLALTLLDVAPERRREDARHLLERLAELEPSAGERVEDLAIQAEARETLSKIRAPRG
ncbi:MAG: hypothetical protein QNK03_11605 [Myxococcota bacterium]|nr:hypothetical protein [Myxococcota bacterium]